MDCPICKLELDGESEPVPNTDSADYACRRCGRYRISGTLEASLESYLHGSRRAEALLSHVVRRLSTDQRLQALTTTFVERVLDEETLPSQ